MVEDMFNSHELYLFLFPFFLIKKIYDKVKSTILCKRCSTICFAILESLVSMTTCTGSRIVAKICTSFGSCERKQPQYPGLEP